MYVERRSSLVLLVSVSRSTWLAGASKLPVSSLAFLHIPKNGGSTIETLGREILNVSWGKYDETFIRDGCSAWHTPQEASGRRLTFCTIRDPARKFVAQFHQENDEEDYCNTSVFETWAYEAIHQVQFHPKRADCHFMLQSDFVKFCDITLRYENLAEDVVNLLSFFTLDNTDDINSTAIDEFILQTHFEGGSSQVRKRRGECHECVDECADNFAKRIHHHLLPYYASDFHLWRARGYNGGVVNRTFFATELTTLLGVGHTTQE